ncbi:MAG: peptidoglycan-binding domain-containing protein, partial [Pyrinomonadaceae bacterium]
LYKGDSTGKLDDATRTSIKSFQDVNRLKNTGTLNRATLEKMGIELTDSQKAIPVDPNSFSANDPTLTKSSLAASGKAASKRKPPFRATKEQIIEAQKLLRAKTMYSGEESGKLDDNTRAGLKKYQERNGVKVTGTLNQLTLEKMGIELTDQQKAASAPPNK